MTTKLRIVAAIAVLLATSAIADARPRHTEQVKAAVECSVSMPCYGVDTNVSTKAKAPNRSYDYDGNGNKIVAHPAGCPRIAFCGCGVSVWAFGESKRELWPAAAYYKFPRDSAKNGNVAIFGRHHVAGIIQAYPDGTADLFDPNSGGHQTRIHRRDISRATIVNPHLGKLALN